MRQYQTSEEAFDEWFYEKNKDFDFLQDFDSWSGKIAWNAAWEIAQQQQREKDAEIARKYEEGSGCDIAILIQEDL